MDSNKRSKEFHRELKEAYFPAIKTEEILNTTIGEELKKASKDSGNMMALVQVQDDGSIGRSWTYEELYKDCLELAKRMSSRHKKGTRVAVWAPNYPEWVIIEFAASIAVLAEVFNSITSIDLSKSFNAFFAHLELRLPTACLNMIMHRNLDSSREPAVVSPL